MRINVGKRGISTSIGVRGATVNFGRRGVRATVGVPGSGISYSALVLPVGQAGSPSPRPEPAPGRVMPPPVKSRAGGNNPASAMLYIPQTGMNEIASASVEVLTSNSLMPLRDLIAKAREQQALAGC